MIEVQARAVVSSEGSVLKLTQVAVGEIPFLVGGQPEGLMPLLQPRASLPSSSSCGGLSNIESHSIKILQEKESASQTEVTVFCNLTTDVTCYPFSTFCS